ncbi:uncharacterized protein LOC116349885 [Contarinia nasturtii]|uniref:uncharacterized protein LOC116349885 n=1 Tax=Contarinia nasturtii TaxID=265458 RepID=UPI0012D44563|nr:uncharacterized protein LOC116349885 [Contarinia nasturtii]
MNRTFLAPFQLQKQFVRNLLSRQQPNKKHVYKRVGNGKQLNGIIYYGRDNFEMPEKLPEPPKLFRVQRFAPLKHRIYWERKILFQLGLINDLKDVAIVKNTPENNALLWKVKHLVSVEPITFPYGEPSADDINHTKLNENGECIVHKKIGVDERCVEEADKFIKDPTRLDKDTLKREALLRWVRSY